MGRKLTEQQRLAIVEKWRESGLSTREFAAIHKCNFHNLRYWVHRSQWNSDSAAEHSFVKLKQPEAPSEKNMSRTRITVRKGMVLEIDENFDKPFLAAAIFLIAGFTR
jgi:transposase-like protein